ncbi:MAG: DUF2177 family protein [Vicinamibacterales bacterium]
MGRTLAQFAVALTAVVVLDAVWLGLLMRNFYRTQFAPIARMSGGVLAPVWPAAAAVYVLLALGVVAFAVPIGHDVATAALRGGLLGLVIYGVYDLTNHATLKNWSGAVTVVDITWGAVLCALVTVVTTIADRWME